MSEYNIKQVLEEWELEDHIREVIEQLTADRQEAIEALEAIAEAHLSDKVKYAGDASQLMIGIAEQALLMIEIAEQALAKLKATKDE